MKLEGARDRSKRRRRSRMALRRAIWKIWKDKTPKCSDRCSCTGSRWPGSNIGQKIRFTVFRKSLARNERRFSDLLASPLLSFASFFPQRVMMRGNEESRKRLQRTPKSLKSTNYHNN